jgi:hypothetical protein
MVVCTLIVSGTTGQIVIRRLSGRVNYLVICKDDVSGPRTQFNFDSRYYAYDVLRRREANRLTIPGELPKAVEDMKSDWIYRDLRPLWAEMGRLGVGEEGKQEAQRFLWPLFLMQEP